MPSLSVCLFIDTDAAPIARSLAGLRDLAREIVVAVDDRFDGDLAPLEAMADVVERRAFTWPLEANLEDLYRMCTGDWILRLDGDEVPSQQLVQELADPAWSRDITHALVPRRWIDPSGVGWIGANPWWPDPQLRLLRRGVSLGDAPRRVHWSPVVEGGSRTLRGPIYHLDLLRDASSREVKARRYHRAAPGVTTHGGASMSLYYVPERALSAPPVLPVPEEDRALIESVAGIRLPMSIPVDPPPGRAFLPSGTELDGVLAVEHLDRIVPSGAEAEALVTVACTGSRPLDSGPETGPVLVGAQWIRAGSDRVVSEDRMALPVAVPPGKSEILRFRVSVPDEPGDWLISFGLVEEGIRWLSRAEPIAVVGRRRPRVQIVSGVSPHPHLGDDLVVEMLVESLAVGIPEAEIVLTGDDAVALGGRFGVPVVPSAGPVVHRGPGGGSRDDVVRRAQEALEAVSSHHDGGALLAPELGGLVDSISRSDALVLATAGSLASRYSVGTVWPRILESAVAAEWGVPVVVTGAGLGPFDRRDRRAVGDLLVAAVHVDVRDARSARLARKARGDRVVAGADIAGLAVRSPGLRLSAEDLLVVSLRHRDSDRVVKRVAEIVSGFVARRRLRVVFLPHEASGDGDDASRVGDLVAHGVEGLEVASSIDGPDLVGGAIAAVGSRFHLGVLAAAAGIPSALVVADRYDRWRAEGLAALSEGSVRVVTRRSSTRGIIDHLGSGAYTPIRPDFPLPVVTGVIAPLLAETIR